MTGFARYIAAVAAGFNALLAGDAAAAAAAAHPPRVHALIISGLPGTPVHARRFADWVGRFHSHLTDACAVPAANVRVLTGHDVPDTVPVDGVATAETVSGELERLTTNAASSDQSVLAVFAHGSTVDGTVKIVLPGPDLPGSELARQLDPLDARQQVALLFFAGSGDLLSQIARPRRITIAATAPAEVAEPIFAEFFLQALEDERADGMATPTGGRKDGVVTLLEAYNWAALETPRWIRRIRKNPENDAWIVSGRRAVPLFTKLYGGPTDMPGARQLAAASNAAIPDPDVPLVTPRDEAASFQHTRVVTEHAVLEDNGMAVGVQAFSAGRFDAIAGRVDGEPGCLARQTVLGQAAPYLETPPEREPRAP